MNRKSIGAYALVAFFFLYAFVTYTSFPGDSGVSSGIAMSTLILLIAVSRTHSENRPINSIFPQSTVLRLGILPLILFGVLTILVIWAIISQIFLVGFLAGVLYLPSFLFATLAFIARKPEI